MNIIVFGDSITQGYWDLEGGWVARLRRYTDQITISSNFNSYYSIYNLGISGDTSKGLIQRFKEDVKRRYDSEDKNLIIIAIGMNDSQIELATDKNEVPLPEFEQNILQLIEISKECNVDLIFIGLTPIDQVNVNPISWRTTHGYQIEQVKKYNNSIQQICITNNIKFLNLLDIFKDIDFRSKLIDGVHPNNNGHKIITDEVLNFLKEIDIVSKSNNPK